jgi:type I restriction enzyme M protein
MEKCRLHTVLRLPTGIFYAQGVKTNVLFFEREKTDKGNTDEVWYYDLRTNMRSFGKTHPLTRMDFAGFEEAYTAEDWHAVQDERWHVFTRDEIRKRDSAGNETNSLDIGLIRDASIVDYDNLPDSIESAEEAVGKLEKAIALLNEVIAKLKSYEVE